MADQQTNWIKFHSKSHGRTFISGSYKSETTIKSEVDIDVVVSVDIKRKKADVSGEKSEINNLQLGEISKQNLTTCYDIERVVSQSPFDDVREENLFRWYKTFFLKSRNVFHHASFGAMPQAEKVALEPLPMSILEKVALMCVPPEHMERTFGDIAEIFRSDIVGKYGKRYANTWYSVQMAKVILTSVGPFVLKMLGLKEVIEKFVK